MKYFFIMSIGIVCVILGAVIWRNILRDFPTQSLSPVDPSSPAVQSPTLQPHVKTVDDNGRTIAYNYVYAAPDQITLYSNMPLATDSASAKKQHRCTTLINAGFYTKENTHLGQFIQNGKEIHPPIRSSLVDGYVWMPQSQIPAITYDPPKLPVLFSLQTGPVVWWDNAPRPLKLIEDKFARRMIAGISAETDRFMFITLYDKDNEHQGPLLARVPDILGAIMQKENMMMDRAVNLDGGSASVWLSDTLSLTEINPIGGYFCIQ